LAPVEIGLDSQVLGVERDGAAVQSVFYAALLVFQAIVGELDLWVSLSVVGKILEGLVDLITAAGGP
jgi:hypothetical protein